MTLTSNVLTASTWSKHACMCCMLIAISWQLQSDPSLAPLSWGQYVGGVIQYFNQTGSGSR
jgi:hypothetical protein